MKEKKNMSLVYEGLGFPVNLVNFPLRKILGEWTLDIDVNKLQMLVLQALIHKPAPLSGSELKFIRKYLEISTSAFGKLFGVTHAAVLKWENNRVHINPATEVCIRLHVLDQLKAKDKEFRDLFRELKIESLLKHKKDKNTPIKIHVNEFSRAA